MVEALAQVGAVAVLLEPRYAGKLPCSAASTACASAARSCPATRSTSRSRWAACPPAAGKGHGTAAASAASVACEADLLFVIADAYGR